MQFIFGLLMLFAVGWFVVNILVPAFHAKVQILQATAKQEVAVAKQQEYVAQMKKLENQRYERETPIFLAQQSANVKLTYAQTAVSYAEAGLINAQAFATRVGGLDILLLGALFAAIVGVMLMRSLSKYKVDYPQDVQIIKSHARKVMQQRHINRRLETSYGLAVLAIGGGLWFFFGPIAIANVFVVMGSIIVAAGLIVPGKLITSVGRIQLTRS